MRSSIIRSTAIVTSIRLVRDLQASLDSLCAMALHALTPRHLQAGLQSNERNPNACRQWLFLQPVAVTVPAPAAFKAAGAAATRPAVTGRRKRGTGTGWSMYRMATTLVGHVMSSVGSPVVRLGRGS